MMRLVHIIPGVDSAASQTLRHEHDRAIESISRAVQIYSKSKSGLEVFEVCDPSWPSSQASGIEVVRSDVDHLTVKHTMGIRPRLRSFFPESLTRDADYIIFTNADICVTPDFYVRVAELISDGALAGSIHRKTILGLAPDQPDAVDKAINSDNWYLHPGSDCFFFPGESAAALRGVNAVMGVTPVGDLMVLILGSLNPSFKKYPETGITFHFGDDREWSTSPSIAKLRRINLRSWYATMPKLILLAGVPGFVGGMQAVGVVTLRDWISLIVGFVKFLLHFPK